MTRAEFELLPKNKQESYAEKQYKIICQEIDDEAVDCDMYYCRGCGQAKGRLDHHHIWAKGMGGSLPLWYYFQKENLILLCRTCHRLIDGTYDQKRGLFCYLECEEIKERLIEENKKYDNSNRF